MKKITFILFALIAGTAFAQTSDSADALVDAKIVSPISISPGAKTLDFGNLIPIVGSTAEVVVNNDGTRPAVADVTIPGIPSQAADFILNSEIGYSYSLTIDPISLTAQGGSGGDPMNVSFTNDDDGANGTGTKTINVGGKLTIGDNQKADTYQGTVTVVVAYN
jgi:spore coat protein U-like protein